MSTWTVRATWIEDEAEVSEQWETNAVTAHDAVRQAMTHMRFAPHHVEARRADRATALKPGESRRLPA